MASVTELHCFNRAHSPGVTGLIPRKPVIRQAVGLKRPQPQRIRPCRLCRAATAEQDTESSSGTREEAGQPSSPPDADLSGGATNSGQQQEAAEEGLASQLRKLRADKPSAQPQGGIQGILEETSLIEWPKPLQAVKDTFVVIGILAGTTIFLFAANSLLADASARFLQH